jgi:hypothetical protein
MERGGGLQAGKWKFPRSKLKVCRQQTMALDHCFWEENRPKKAVFEAK